MADPTPVSRNPTPVTLGGEWADRGRITNGGRITDHGAFQSLWHVRLFFTAPRHDPPSLPFPFGMTSVDHCRIPAPSGQYPRRGLRTDSCKFVGSFKSGYKHGEFKGCDVDGNPTREARREDD